MKTLLFEERFFKYDSSFHNEKRCREQIVQNFRGFSFPFTKCSTGIVSTQSKGTYMQIQFRKNIQFTRLIKVDGRLREFNFRKAGTIGDGFFSVDVSDDKGNRVMFRLQKEDGTWRFQPEQILPVWILRIEPEFHDLIETELGNA